MAINQPQKFIVPVFFLWVCAFGCFAQTSSGRSPGLTNTLRVSTDFPGGSATVEGSDPDTQTIRITPAGNPDKGWPCWWYFRVDGVDKTKPLVVEVRGGNSFVQSSNKSGFSDGRIPRKRLNPAWSLPAQAAVSTDRITWEHTEKGERQGNRMTFRINPTSSTLWLAWGPPFLLDDANRLMESAERQCASAKRFEFARSKEGRVVPGLMISAPGSSGPARRGVWIQARTHAWESGGSWVSCGLINWLVSDDPGAVDLRKRADIVVIPIMDADSVERGEGGKKQVPHDHDEDWGDDPFWPEVKAAISRLKPSLASGHLAVFLDLHNSGPDKRNISTYIPAKPLLTPSRILHQDTFMKIMKEQLVGSLTFTGEIGPLGDTYDPKVDKTSDSWTAHLSGPDVVSLTFESPWNTPGSTQAGYLEAGKQLGKCIDLYLRTLDKQK